MYDANIVIQVKYLQENGKSYREICEIMKIPKSSVGCILNNRKKDIILRDVLNVKLVKGCQQKSKDMLRNLMPEKEKSIAHK